MASPPAASEAYEPEPQANSQPRRPPQFETFPNTMHRLRTCTGGPRQRGSSPLGCISSLKQLKAA
eukprot:9286821-Alexandrium_andersonii.AAC.1